MILTGSIIARLKFAVPTETFSSLIEISVYQQCVLIVFQWIDHLIAWFSQTTYPHLKVNGKHLNLSVRLLTQINSQLQICLE